MVRDDIKRDVAVIIHIHLRVRIIAIISIVYQMFLRKSGVERRISCTQLAEPGQSFMRGE
jgi:hypothetical protein